MSEARDKATDNMDGWVAGKDGSAAAVAATGADLPWRWQEGDLTVTRTAAWSAPGCHLGCGVKVYTDDEGRFVKLEGDEESPYYQGRLCARCIALKEAVYHPDRVLYPMKRDPQRPRQGTTSGSASRGTRRTRRSTSKFDAIKAESGAKAVVFHLGHGARDGALHVRAWQYAFGSVQYAYMLSGNSCYVPRVSACNVLMGTLLRARTARRTTSTATNTRDGCRRRTSSYGATTRS